MKLFNLIAGGMGAMIALIILMYFDPNPVLGSIILWSLIGGLVATYVLLELRVYLRIPQTPKPSRKELIEAKRVDLERQIAEATEACGSEEADVVRSLHTDLIMFNYLCLRTRSK